MTDGYAPAVPPLRMAMKAFLVEDLDPDVALRRLELAAITAADLLDDASVERLITDWVDRARREGRCRGWRARSPSAAPWSTRPPDGWLRHGRPSRKRASWPR